MKRIIIAVTTALLLADVAAAHPEADHSESAVLVGTVAPSARPATAVVDAFHAALRRGDTDTAQSFLADDALIYEAGGVEHSKQEYASHHLGADAVFAQAVPGKIMRRAGQAVGNIAWIASEGRTTGTYKDKAVDRITTETMVLRRDGTGWKIVHIHWSSAAGGN